jgi:hypothetical protein
MEAWGGGRPFCLFACVREGAWALAVRCGAERGHGHGMAGKEMALVLALLLLDQE